MPATKKVDQDAAEGTPRPADTRPLQTDGASRVSSSDGAAAELAPTMIRPNPLNPRMFFTDSEIEELAESIEQIGVLVPLTVYEDQEGNATHVLLDGERRWKAATLINLEKVPVWVIPKPDGVENVLRMFNIHMLRREWDEIATAWALQKLAEELGTNDTSILHEKTGLSRDRIRNIKSVLSFPRHIQDRVASGDIPFQFLVELEKNILSQARKHEDSIKQSADELQNAFLQKYDERRVETVELRKAGKLLASTRLGGTAGERASRAWEELVEKPEITIEEAYEAGAAYALELGKVMRDLRDLPDRIRAVLQSDLDPQDRTTLKESVKRLVGALKDELKTAQR